MESKTLKRRLLVMVLALLMVVTTLPTVAFAGEAQDLEWWNFRNTETNNSITERPAITTSDEAWLKWGVKYGTGWAAAPTPPLILDGYLYIGVGNQVKKLDKETGECVATSGNMVANVGYAMNPIIYADGRLFVQVGNGMIQCLDYETLEPLWSTTRIGGQTVSPISYVKIDGTGYIYTGTWNAESKNGNFMCFTTDDSKVVDGKKEAEWMFIPKTDDPVLAADEDASPRGFYWAGAYANENYIAVGSDDGTAEGAYTANAVFYTLDPKTGEIIDRVDHIRGDIRSTVVYDSGYLYFTTKGGLLNRVSVDADGNLGELQQLDMGGMITAACTIYNGRLYVGVCGQSQFSPDSGHRFAVVDVSGETMREVYSLPIQGYPQAAALVSTSEVNRDFDADGEADGRVYIYFTYNYPPGGIYYVYDEPGQTAPCLEQGELFVPQPDMQQYCISTIIADREGTLYYKNDSCYLMAVEKNLATLNNLVVSGVGAETTECELDKEFAPYTPAYSTKVSSSATAYQIELTMPSDVSATVNGEAYTAGTPLTFDMEETSATATIVTTATNGDTRTYTVTIEKQSADSSLSELKVSSSNTYNTSLVTLTPTFDTSTTEYTTAQLTNTRTFYNLWPTATSPGAKVEVIAGENVKNYAPGQVMTRTAVNGTHDRYAIYANDLNMDQTVTVRVTSENGEATSEYTVRFCRQIYVTDVSLDKTTAEMTVGETLALVPTIEPSNASVKTVTWESSDEDVATVDENGTVTAVGAGEATITVKTDDGDFTATCTVTVAEEQSGDIAVTGVTVNKTLKINEGETGQLTAVIAPANATNQNVTWTSSKTSVATVDENGVVTGVKNGTANITVTTEDGNYSAVCKVTVSVDLNRVKSEAIAELENYKNPADYRDAEAAQMRDIIELGKTGIQESPNPMIVMQRLNAMKVQLDALKTAAQYDTEEAAAVDEMIAAIGEVTLDSQEAVEAARAAYDALTDGGKAKVENLATLEAAEATLVVLNTPVDVTGITLPKTARAYIGETTTLTPTIAPENATNKAVTWTSSKTSVATVDENGVVTGVSTGTANITATTADGNYSATTKVTVTVNLPKIKEDAIADIQNYADPADYRAEEAAQLEAIVEQAVADINAQVSPGYIGAIVANAKADIDKLRTAAEYDAQAGHVTGVTVPNTMRIVEGKTATIEATVMPEDATNKAVTWASSNEAVATVDENGVVTAVATGNADITVTTVDGQFTAKTKVTVIVDMDKIKAAAIAEIQNYADPADYRDAEAEQLEAIVSQAVTEINAQINPGFITRIIDVAKTNIDKLKTAAEYEAEEAVSGITLDQTSATINRGETTQLTATVTPDTAINKNVEWISSDESVATVSSDGTVTAVAAGAARITAKTEDGGYTATCNVTVVLTLDDVKDDAMAELDEYADPSDYRDAEAAELADIIENAKKDMEAAETEDEVAGILAEAKDAIDELKTDAEYDAEEAESAAAVDELIDAIGDVTLDSKEAIDTAREAYDALNDNEKALVENLETLEAAEEAYADLLDQQAADEVADMIDEIGKVSVDSEDAIEAAREAYDALTDAQKELVDNYDKLLEAEAAFKTITSEPTLEVVFPLDNDGLGVEITTDAAVFTKTVSTGAIYEILDVSPEDLLGVEIDGETVDPANYVVYEGSICVKFSGAYLETLATGEHDVTFYTTYGYGKSKLIVKDAPVPEDKDPAGDDEANKDGGAKTGDGAMPGLAGLAAILALGTLVVARRKEEK